MCFDHAWLKTYDCVRNASRPVLADHRARPGSDGDPDAHMEALRAVLRELSVEEILSFEVATFRTADSRKESEFR
jgi:hypothetical protein